MNSQLAKILFSCLFFVLTFSATAQTVPESTEVVDTAAVAANQSSEISPEPASKNDAIDPWQRYNRAMFSFNSTVDKHFLKPLAKTYVSCTPTFFRQGVSNVFSNIMDVPNALNDVLQGKLSKAAHNTGRVLINTTLGLAGLLDVAQHMGLESDDGEDFGQTLAVWGIGSGPYVVLPFLGPSTLRDTAALPVDWYSDPKTYIEDVPTKNTVRAVSIIDTRASFLPLEKSVTGDKYLFIRDAYLQRRNYLEKDGQVEDSFGVDESENGDYGL